MELHHNARQRKAVRHLQDSNHARSRQLPAHLGFLTFVPVLASLCLAGEIVSARYDVTLHSLARCDAATLGCGSLGRSLCQLGLPTTAFGARAQGAPQS